VSYPYTLTALFPLSPWHFVTVSIALILRAKRFLLFIVSLTIAQNIWRNVHAMVKTFVMGFLIIQMWLCVEEREELP
jgi:hypothetical protein